MSLCDRDLESTESASLCDKAIRSHLSSPPYCRAPPPAKFCLLVPPLRCRTCLSRCICIQPQLHYGTPDHKCQPHCWSIIRLLHGRVCCWTSLRFPKVPCTTQWKDYLEVKYTAQKKNGNAHQEVIYSKVDKGAAICRKETGKTKAGRSVARNSPPCSPPRARPA